MANPTKAGKPISARYAYAVAAYGTTTAGTGDIYNPNGSSDANFSVIDNSEVSADFMQIEDDVTTSYNVNGTRKFAGLVDPRVTITLPEDDPSTLDSGGTLIPGCYYTLWLRRGNSSTTSHQWDCITNTMFLGMRKTNPTSTGIKRTVTAEFVGGDVTTYTAASANLATYIGGLSPVRT